MKLSYTSFSKSDEFVIDLDDMVEQSADEEELVSRLTAKIGGDLIGIGVSWDSLTGSYVSDGSGDLYIADNGDGAWITEVAQLAWYLAHMPSWHESDAVFAWIEGQNWRWTNFDELSKWEDYYSQEYDGDAEDFGHNWMHEVAEGLPDHLESYFDFEKYGEDILDGYYQYEWNGRTFLFHQH